MMAPGREEDAFKYLQMALITAMTPQAKTEAGLVMAEFLLDRATMKPEPYALMARQYLEAVLDIAEKPEARLRTYRGIMKAAALMKDIHTVANACDKAIKLTPDDDVKVKFLLARIDAFLDVGTWKDVKQLLAEAEPYSTNPKWQYEFALRKAVMTGQVLLRDDWFEEWMDYTGGTVSIRSRANSA
ncbi:unnamed protein product, partial [marine sediment metagenome]